MLETAGLVYSYCYEDLVFVESSIVLFQMGDLPADIKVYFLVDCPETAAQDLEIKLTLAAKTEGLRLTLAGKYKLAESGKNEIQVEFIDQCMEV